MYDIGANIGLYSLFAAKHLRGNCKVYAFEPEALNHARLSRNIYLNGMSTVVLPCCVAITDELCFNQFYLNPNSFETVTPGEGLVAGSALHSFGAPVDEMGAEFRSFHQQGTVGVSIDHLWREWGLDFPNHVKIDVDGLEEKIIAGGQRTLADPRLRSVLVEIAPQAGQPGLIVERLTDAGFQQVTDFAANSSESLRGSPWEGFVNHVFIRDA
jgi:FkbM family methyltransferase